MTKTIHHYMRFAATLLTASLLLTATSAAHAQAIAMVTDATGKAVLLGGANPVPVAILAEITAAARVQLDAGARVTVLLLQSGDEYILEGPSLVSFAAREPVALSGNAPQKRTVTPARAGDVRIPRGAIAQAAFVMRSARGTSRIKLLNLHNTRSLAPDPEFRWESGEADARYTFELSDDAGKSLYQTEINATTLRLPANVQLRDGAGYTWEVSMRLNDGRRYISYG